MFTFAYLFLFASILLFIETLLRSAGILIPLVPLFLFYTTGVFGGRRAILAALIVGLVAGSLQAIAPIWCPFSYCVCVLMAWSWLRRGESDSPLWLAGPGAILPIFVYLPVIFWYGGFPLLFRMTPSLFLSVLVSAIILPVGTVLFDSMNRGLRVDLFTNARLKSGFGRRKTNTAAHNGISF